jgi:hypothetical protein
VPLSGMVPPLSGHLVNANDNHIAFGARGYQVRPPGGRAPARVALPTLSLDHLAIAHERPLAPRAISRGALRRAATISMMPIEMVRDFAHKRPLVQAVRRSLWIIHEKKYFLFCLFAQRLAETRQPKVHWQ